MRFDLNDLQLLIYIADSGSITAGAQRANLSLAAASARVHGMELALGVPLFERGRRGVQPSAAGHAAVHHAQRVLQQIERMHGELSEHAQGMRGQIRMLSNTAALTEFLPDILSDFLTRNPTIDIDVEERPSQDIPRALMENRADIGVMASTADMKGLQTFPFRTDRLVVVAPKSHPLAARAAGPGVAFAEIVSQDFVGLADGSALQEHLARHAEQLGKRLKYRVRLRSFDVICQMVEREVGIGILPERAAERCARTLAIQVVPLTDEWASRELRICLRSFDDLPAYGKRLIEALRG
ncbi:LysR family transcriptional regulator [Burkholderia sp. WAC0059]|uniref:LysR family transcriptional regulator n=1 Tax=Burkholderia sp. WAC0059 TaxID=2066022 RepID=UPI000C7EE7F5|nr:LysR substrate-binding domain-containing protein [Burkholderia sp. WAC0059]PLZ02127.1 LysR family transcriptional regulator [Burkholderia sp. WAC0059]